MGKPLLLMLLVVFSKIQMAGLAEEEGVRGTKALRFLRLEAGWGAQEGFLASRNIHGSEDNTKIIVACFLVKVFMFWLLCCGEWIMRSL
jgi:hypothetical protein